MEHRSFSVGRSAVQTSATPASPDSPRRSAMRQRRRVAHWLNRSAMEAVRLGARADDLAALRAVADRLRADTAGLAMVCQGVEVLVRRIVAV